MVAGHYFVTSVMESAYTNLMAFAFPSSTFYLTVSNAGRTAFILAKKSSTYGIFVIVV